MKKYVNFIMLFLIILMTFSCELPNQPGPMPKKIIDLDFEPGLNILGVIKLYEDKTESFIYVEKALKTKEYYEIENYPIVKNADVKISAPEDTSFTFKIDEDIDSTRYVNENFLPEENQIYTLNIKAEEDNDSLHLTASTIVPTIPSIDTSSIKISNNDISFDLNLTLNAFSYEIVIIFENDEIKQKIIKNANAVQNTKIYYPKNYGKPLLIFVAAYDENLTKYLSATSSLIPQTYHESISTVENGYGSFGSVSINTFEIKEGNL